MRTKIIEALQKRTYHLQFLRSSIQDNDESSNALNEGINEMLPSLQPINPIQEIGIPESQEINLEFPMKQYRGKPIEIRPSSHETGLFLLPYTERFKNLFISEFQGEIAPIKILLVV